jgi:trk system potassium uptake protein TrkH
MSPFRSGGRGVSWYLRILARARHLLFTTKPARLLAFGYLSYMIAGWLLLNLPFAQTAPQRALDTLFTAVSAVSTTGLSTIDTGTSFTLFGEIVVLALIQLGGLGYMTVSSFAFLALRNKMTGARQQTTRAVFGLPGNVSPKRFIMAVVAFTLTCEVIGAGLLWIAFAQHGVDGAFWLGLFHAVSAFCTAGFSLFPTSLEGFRPDTLINWTISGLSLLGALGFIVVADVVQWFRSEPIRILKLPIAQKGE